MAMKNYPEEFKADAVALYESTPGATIKGIARDLGVSRETLRLWVRRAAEERGQVAAATSPGAGATESAEPPVRSGGRVGQLEARVAELEAANRRLEAERRTLTTEREILRKAAKYFGGRDDLVSRFQFVAEHHPTYSVKRLCQVLGINRSSYYKWQAGADARAVRAAQDAVLAARIRVLHEEDPALGSPRVTSELRKSDPRADPVNHKRVARVMREHSITGIFLRKKVRTTVPDPFGVKVGDLIKRDFTAPAPNCRYVGDITYLPVGGGRFLYLATVIDLFSRRLAGWSIADHMRTSLVADALNAAAAERGTLAGAIFHSDHGTQYGSRDYAMLCAKLQVTQSMGAVGTSADNAAAESFNATLKRELLAGKPSFDGPRAARLAVFRWATRYNTRRPHSRLGNQSPADYERSVLAATLQSAA
ncbi:IS3 family transposase [Promicromonospora soli]